MEHGIVWSERRCLVLLASVNLAKSFLSDFDVFKLSPKLAGLRLFIHLLPSTLWPFNSPQFSELCLPSRR